MNKTADLTTPTVLPNSYLTLHYRLSDDAGDQHVSTFDLSPATIQMGCGQLAEPLEQCLISLHTCQRCVFNLDAKTAFGQHNPQLIERISRSALPAKIELKKNALIEFGTPDGAGFAGLLRELTPTTALFDFNHPLAGKAIRFEVEITGIM